MSNSKSLAVNSSVAVKNEAEQAIMSIIIADAGDMTRLTKPQWVDYYFMTCASLGLNPYTKPFLVLKLNGKQILYATKDCTDQLRNIRAIDVTIVNKQVQDDLIVVTARAWTPTGRTDEDFGAVSIANLKGEALANAMMKAATKAKRRVTLAICGLGANDESDVETIQGAVMQDIALPPQPLLTEQPPAATAEPPAEDDEPPLSLWLQSVQTALAENLGTGKLQAWMAALHLCLQGAPSLDELAGVRGLPAFRKIHDHPKLPKAAKVDIEALFTDALARLRDAPTVDDFLPEPEAAEAAE